MNVTKEEFFKEGERIFGKDKKTWKYKCPNCNYIQSANSVTTQMKGNVPSLRHGIVEIGDLIFPHCECYSPTCNWVAYGLFNSGILVIFDSSKPFNKDTKENCGYAFPFAGATEQ